MRGDLTPFPGILVMLCQSSSDLEPDCKGGFNGSYEMYVRVERRP